MDDAFAQLRASHTTRFWAFAKAQGLIVETLLADGFVHRVPTKGAPKKFAGAYQFDGFVGWAQNWQTQKRPMPYQSWITYASKRCPGTEPPD